ncbi:hypothetical protein [Paraliomyxa miuraensis]|uniref:hypothetical protein n=1 Tax=Paraliomyxa miuraensis TaxID=376150 RepID=UPI002256FFA3|nr:hypothetical protein [Paraliomyxa miuraensis]MCX4240939.1 hypothetical protein [Paraliomyxa miuraensis]
MCARATPIGRSVASVLLAGLGASACYDDVRPPWALSDDPVVLGISLAVVEDGPYAIDLAPLPADRPRAEVLPLDVVELDALVADIDGPLPLDDAAWVLCGAGCLASLEEQGRRFGELPDCHEGSVAQAHACLAGRGNRPQVVIPEAVPPDELPLFFDWSLFPRVLLVSGRAGGLGTDACLEQLVLGPPVDLVGCAIGASDLVYGPEWVLGRLLTAAGLEGWDDGDLPPSEVLELLPPNTAAVFERVRVGPYVFEELLQYGEDWEESLPLHPIDEELEVQADIELIIVPEVPLRDQQIVLSPQGPGTWLGRFEWFHYDVWVDDPEIELLAWAYGYVGSIFLRTPPAGRTFRLYVKATDRPGDAVSWFTLTLRTVER